MNVKIASSTTVEPSSSVSLEQDPDFLHPIEASVFPAVIFNAQRAFHHRYDQGSFLLCSQRPGQSVRMVLELDFPQGSYTYPVGPNRSVPMTSAERAQQSVCRAAAESPFEYLGQGQSVVYYKKGHAALLLNTQCGRIIMSTFFGPRDHRSFLLHTAMLLAVTTALTRLRPSDELPRFWLDQTFADMKKVDAVQGPKAIEYTDQMFDTMTNPAIRDWRQAQARGELHTASRVFFH